MNGRRMCWEWSIGGACSALVPPKRVKVDGTVLVGGRFEKSRRGSATWSSKVTAPAVTESALKSPGRLIEPGVYWIEVDPFFAPMRVPDDIVAASWSPGGKLSQR